jgi:hypothetical protein
MAVHFLARDAENGRNSAGNRFPDSTENTFNFIDLGTDATPQRIPFKRERLAL